MLNVALFGAPGAGKGTQSARLIEKYKLTYISTGEILRAEMKNGTELGLEAQKTIEAGKLVSDEIIVKIIGKIIKSNLNSSGFLYDGFPRTVAQAEALTLLLGEVDTKIDSFVFLDVPFSMCVERLLNRAKTSGRSDDNEITIKKRLVEYENKTAPVADYYRNCGTFVSIDGVGTEEVIFDRILDSLNKSVKA